MFTQKDFNQLANVQSQMCLTIYVPTNRSGEQTFNRHDALVLKDALKDAREQLETSANFDRGRADVFLAKAEELVEDEYFWRHQSDTLALFITADKMETFSLPIPSTNSTVYVGDRYHLSVAARVLAPASRWYVYSVTQDENKFFECTRSSVTEIMISDLVPKDMDEVLEIYEGGESLQHHGKPRQVAGGGGSVFTGQGSNEDRHDERLEILFRRLGNGITTLIAGQTEPLVLVADDQYISGLRSSIDYPNIIEESININPAVLDPVAIQRETWRLVQPIFDKQVEELQDKFASASGGGSLANGLSDVVLAARNNQIAVLYVAEEASGRMGKLAADGNTVEFSNDPDSVDLLEQAIRETINHGGQIMYRLAEQVPDSTDGVTAVLRYQV